ncbi:AAA family ATPase [Enterococcus casseliflavus]|uniref:AAA family ATPase n=2 Tax=Enterococcus casseliflavus TaxID=37734 RepID=UPI003D104E05
MISIFSFKKKNKEAVSEAFGGEIYPILINTINTETLNNMNFDNIHDLTSLIIRTDSQWQNIIESFIIVLESVKENFEYSNYCFVVDRFYFKDIQEILSWNKNVNFFIAENEFDIESVKSITNLNKEEFMELGSFINKKLIGNEYFKKRLVEELKKFRLFYTIEEQKIFSCLLFGASGIGKTETARIISKFLSPKEKLIKINLGNYSGKESLSSLIGSPRGFVGSQEGELSSKILKSDSKVILIDEFEKSDNTVHNFFLELLEDGKFTDSLGREFDLSGYIIIFTYLLYLQSDLRIQLTRLRSQQRQ